jgi:hypothetical protein
MLNNQTVRRFLTILLVLSGVAVFSLTTQLWAGITLIALGIALDEVPTL